MRPGPFNDLLGGRRDSSRSTLGLEGNAWGKIGSFGQYAVKQLAKCIELPGSVPYVYANNDHAPSQDQGTLRQHVHEMRSCRRVDYYAGQDEQDRQTQQGDAYPFARGQTGLLRFHPERVPAATLLGPNSSVQIGGSNY